MDYRESSEDEEVKLLSHRKGADEPDSPGADIRDVPEEASDTQQDEWLLKTEPLQGARPKWNKGGRPPVVPDQTGVLDIEATGGVVSRNVEQRGAPTPLLPLDQQIMQEAELITPPRREAHGHGGRRAPEPQLPPIGTQVVPRFLRTSGQGTSVRTDGMTHGRLRTS